MKKLWKIGLVLSFMLILQSNINFVNAENLQIQPNNEQTVYIKISEEKKNNINIIKTSIWSDIIKQGSNFLSAGQESTDEVLNPETLNDASSAIYNLLLGIAIVLAVIVGGVLGIQFMIASAEDKAEIKKAMIPYIIGCIVIFGAFTIWKIVVNIVQTIAVS